VTGAFRFGDDQMTLIVCATQTRNGALTTLHFCDVEIWMIISPNAVHRFSRCFSVHAQQAIY
jgi:hypothetical protein